MTRPWKFLSITLAGMGLLVKTIASSLSSPSSFSSIVTGFHSTRHNVYWWADCLPAYIYEYYAGSKRYIYLMDWRLPPNGGRIYVKASSK